MISLEFYIVVYRCAKCSNSGIDLTMNCDILTIIAQSVNLSSVYYIFNFTDVKKFIKNDMTIIMTSKGFP